jgi:succinoglycan biosynthesis transport protein ExoP
MTKDRKFKSILSVYQKESPAGTEFRRLFSNINAKSQDHKIQNIMITSATIGEGKSLICSLLAITIAELTRLKVALVDFDLRRPKISFYFGLDKEIGVSDVLTGKSTLKLASQKMAIPNLAVITSGIQDVNPSDVLDQENISGFFQELRFYFDYVIIDSPPVVPVSDPLILSEYVDGVLLVVRGGATQREVVNRAANLLINAKVNILGVVLNDYDEVLPYYYKHRYYGYDYYGKKHRGS